MNIQEIHESVFKFLLKKRESNPSLRYNLRFQNDEKMRKGHWFHDSTADSDVYITFWNEWGPDNRLTFPTINFTINQDGSTELRIDERRNGGQVEIWNDLKMNLGLEETVDFGLEEKVRKNASPLWKKGYDKSKPYLDNLNDFIETERPFINTFLKLKNREADYLPFPEGKFLRNLSKVESFRKAFNSSTPETAVSDDFPSFLEQKLTVNCLQLHNINVFKSANISFDKQVTCFVGGNGSGKTTLLRGIALGLVGSKGFTTEKLNLLAIKEARKKPIKYEGEGSITVFYKFKGKDCDNSISFKSDSKEQVEVELLEDTGQSLRDETESKLLQTLIIGFSQQAQSDKDTRANGFSNPKLSDVEALIFNDVDNRFKEFKEWLETKITAPAQVDRLDNKEIIKDIFKSINKIIFDKIELTSETDTFVRTNRNPRGIPMDFLSQGYKNVLAWLGYFMKRMVDYQDSLTIEVEDFRQLPAVCLIDEIDTYLHPDWQYAILGGLVEQFPNVQFFITSHSPLVLTSVPHDKLTIFELNTEGGDIVIKELQENLYGADANRATDAISTEREKHIQDKFTALKALIYNNKLDEAEKMLEHDFESLESSDPDIVAAKSRINTKRMFQKK